MIYVYVHIKWIRIYNKTLNLNPANFKHRAVKLGHRVVLKANGQLLQSYGEYFESKERKSSYFTNVILQENCIDFEKYLNIVFKEILYLNMSL